MHDDFESEMEGTPFPPMQIIGDDEVGRSVAQKAYLRALREGVEEVRQQGEEPDFRLLAQVASDIAQEAYDAFCGR